MRIMAQLVPLFFCITFLPLCLMGPCGFLISDTFKSLRMLPFSSYPACAMCCTRSYAEILAPFGFLTFLSRTPSGSSQWACAPFVFFFSCHCPGCTASVEDGHRTVDRRIFARVFQLYPYNGVIRAYLCYFVAYDCNQTMFSYQVRYTNSKSLSRGLGY